MAKTAKEKHKINLLEYLGNPENPFCNRNSMALALGIKRVTLYAHFTPTELTEIEEEALKERRKKYAPHLSKVDISVLEKAAEGDTQAAKLAYQRFEGWTEKQRLDHSSEDGTMTPPQRIEIVAAGFDDDSEA